MIEHLSITIANAWGNSKIIPQGDVPIYRYGLELLFSTLANFTFMVTISVISGNTWAFLPYTISFALFRSTAGGFHAKTHWSCILISISTFTVVLFFVTSLNDTAGVWFVLLSSTFSLTIFVLFSPVPAANKPLGKPVYDRNRRFVLILATAYVSAALILLMLNFSIAFWIQMLFAGMGCAALSLLAAKLFGSA